MADLSAVTAKYKDFDETLIDHDSVERAEVQQKGIKWGSYVGTHITAEELKMIEEFEVPHFSREDVMRIHGRKYARLFMVVLSKVKSTPDLRYIVTLVADVLETVPGSYQHFFDLHSEKAIPGIPGDLPFGPLFGLLGRKEDDPYIVNKVSSILTFFLVSFTKVRTDMVESSIHWFIKKLGEDPSTPNYYRVEMKALENLRTLLKVPRYRLIFARESGIEPVFELTKIESTFSAIKAEIVYQALYCLWLLSYHPVVKKTMAIFPLYNNLCKLLRVCQERDKIVRMVLAILKNLLDVGDKQLMLTCGLERLLQQLKTRGTLMSDKDAADDLEALEKDLEVAMEDLSTFDVYLQSVQVKNLDWTSPVHKSEKFWRENCFRIEGSPLLPMLKDILESETNNTILCVTCWDLGEFIRFHPQGKVIIQQLGAKEILVKLLGHPDSEVSNHALMTLQKLMVTNWDSLAQ